jgi:hypothetical protein
VFERHSKIVNENERGFQAGREKATGILACFPHSWQGGQRKIQTIQWNTFEFIKK